MTNSFLQHIGRRLGAAIFCLLAVVVWQTGCRQSNPAPALSKPALRAETKPTSAQIRTDVGFATRQKFLDHYDKHGAEFGSISKEEYLRQAQELRDRPTGKDVLEVRRADGVITRFDRSSGTFLAFNPDLTIRTFFKPNDGESYFHRQSKRPARSEQ
ncbi:MAG TPA: hypothetical protein PKC13_08710 [Blastocatellia bacterium]|nr:hypothetical protein [Blastocatellia bacterium]HNG33462.1 hypothetical protein [Blastocatellia bacterium]